MVRFAEMESKEATIEVAVVSRACVCGAEQVKSPSSGTDGEVGESRCQ